MAKRQGTEHRKADLSRLGAASRDNVKNVGDLQKDPGTGKDIVRIPVDRLDDAPAAWNRFHALWKSDDPAEQTKFAELVMSVGVNGVWQPLIVWEQPGGRYMILSGHNRREACIENMRRAATEEEKEKFFSAPCIVYGADEIDETKAREIIIDTNYIQRQDNAKEVAWLVKDRMDLLRTQRTSSGENVRAIAESFGIQKSSVYENLAIAEKLAPELQDLYFDEKVTRKNILKAAALAMDVQEWMCDGYRGRIDDAALSRLKRGMTKDDVAAVFDGPAAPPTKTLRVRVPADRYDPDLAPALEAYLMGADAKRMDRLMELLRG